MGKKKTTSKKQPKADKPSESKVKVQPTRVAPTVTLAQWFAQKLDEGKVKPWQYNTIKLYSSKQGLTEQETADQYDKMFEKF